MRFGLTDGRGAARDAVRRAGGHTLSLIPGVVVAWLIAVSAVFGTLRTHAESALIETVTMTAAREAVRVYVQEIRLDTGAPTPMATQLPGAAPAAPIFSPTPDSFLTATADTDHGSPSIIAGAAVSGTAVGNDAWRRLSASGPILAGTVAGGGAQAPLAVVVSRIDDGPLRGYGRIDAWSYATSAVPTLSSKPSYWYLPGEPVAAAANSAGGWVAVLCRAPNGAPVLHLRDVVRGRVIQERVPLTRPNERVEPAALAYAKDGSALFAVLNDVDAASDSDEGRCWVAALDPRSGGPLGAPLELPGTVDAPGAIAFAGDGMCWVATRSPSAGFAFVHRLARDAGGCTIQDRQSYSGLSRGLVIAASGNASAAVAVDRRLEIWKDGKPAQDPVLFDAPIAALCWSADVLLAGEANRVHALDSDGAERWVTRLQTGHVAAIERSQVALAPDRFSDTDGDRLADAVDPEPDLPSPRLDVPPEIVLHEAAAGMEVRAVRVDSTHAQRSIWRVDVDATAAPWLRVFPRQGRVPGWFFVGVDPSLLMRDGEVDAAIDVTMTGTNLSTYASESPRRIAVRVTPRGKAAHAVLWLLAGQDRAPRNARDSHDLNSLAEALSGPPFYWSHISGVQRAGESLDDYAAIVLESAAIDTGAVSRQALLDYVSRGGGLLVIAQARRSETGVSQRWLAPAGIVLEPGAAASGTMKAAGSHPVSRHWADFAMDAPARIAPDTAMTVLAARGDAPGLAVRQFGRGRIAVLASRSPLESKSMGDPAHALFALDLFEWLTRAAIETKDIDADGLPDDLEDLNGNGVMDRGETNKFDPDSDGDGVPDGKEDANANGRVDEGETNPLSADTDGDGDRDGADADPLPPIGAPAISGVTPASGPAEGGARVTIDGRNLGNIASVWFGERQAVMLDPSGGSSLAVETPPAGRDGDAVDVRVVNARGQSATLSGGFVYTARSRALIQLEAVASTDAQTEGMVTVSVTVPPGVRLGRIAIRLNTEPENEFEWYDLRATPEAELAGRRVVQGEPETWGIRFEVTPAERMHEVSRVATVRCRSRSPLGDRKEVIVLTTEAEVSAANGEPLDVEPARATMRWDGRQGS